MKVLKAILISFTLIFSVTAEAQNWSDEQKEVWAFVEEYSKAQESGDYEKFMEALHTDYRGWSYESVVPVDRETVGKYVQMGMERYIYLFSNRIPLSIQVFDDYAVVHYMFHSITQDKKSAEKMEIEGRWTDILIKEGKNWYLVADHGGNFPGDD